MARRRVKPLRESLSKGVDPKLIEELKRQGFELKPIPEELVVKTFKIPKRVAGEFYARVAAKDMLLQDAVAEALEMWLKANR